ncbi:DUF4148 domain-containing protein [Pararobbsia alpina]|uniref:DUF4148 domain-containing protein n=1 Tax=Pararobbsia alpina TaxID=621374 RepID=A0A6S7CQ02_9BURK|nr:DUF4148 domain-containing protein [Pararobbsia alpina]CAB3785018.1 hypothetical protein LMG28138_01931 [Pararobbsia alpina]
MKRTLISALLVSAAAALAAPAFAQSTGDVGLTRAEVKAQLVQAEEQGKLIEQTPRNNFPVGRDAQPRQYAVAPHHVANTDVAATAPTSGMQE